MLDNMHETSSYLWELGLSKRKTHVLGILHKTYYDELADTACIENIPVVYSDIFFDAISGLDADPNDFRNTKFRVINDNEYEKMLETLK